jgi:hypothetical protein
MTIAAKATTEAAEQKQEMTMRRGASDMGFSFPDAPHRALPRERRLASPQGKRRVVRFCSQFNEQKEQTASAMYFSGAGSPVSTTGH